MTTEQAQHSGLDCFCVVTLALVQVPHPNEILDLRCCGRAACVRLRERRSGLASVGSWCSLLFLAGSQSSRSQDFARVPPRSNCLVRNVSSETISGSQCLRYNWTTNQNGYWQAMRKNELEHLRVGILCTECGTGQHKPIKYFRKCPKLTCDGCGAEIRVDNKQLQASIVEFDITMTRLRRTHCQ